MAAISIILQQLIKDFEKFKGKIDTIFKDAIVYEGLQCDGKQKYVAPLVKDLEIL